MLIQPIFFGLFFNDLLSFIGVGGVGLGTVCAGALLVTLPVMLLTYRASSRRPAPPSSSSAWR